MKQSLTILLMASINACQYRERPMTITLPQEVPLQTGCLAQAKTIQPITDQLGTIIYLEKLAFISLPPPHMNIINYLPCNLPPQLRNGQQVRFSAQVKFQPEIRNGAVIDYIGQEIELTQLTRL